MRWQFFLALVSFSEQIYFDVNLGAIRGQIEHLFKKLTGYQLFKVDLPGG